MKIVSIYKSPRKDEMYVYTEKRDALTKVPEALLDMFGTPIHVMDMPLTADKTLARVETDKLFESLNDKGYYLQMPPPKEDYMLDLYQDRPETGVR